MTFRLSNNQQQSKHTLELARRASRLPNLQSSFFFFARMSCSEQSAFHGQTADPVWFFSELLFQSVKKERKTSRGSFSAVLTPISSNKYSLESSRRDLHNAPLCTVLQSQFFRQKSQILRILRLLARIFDEFFSGFRVKFQKIVTCVAFSIKFAKTNQKFAENSEFCEN